MEFIRQELERRLREEGSLNPNYLTRSEQKEIQKMLEENKIVYNRRSNLYTKPLYS